MGDLRLSFNLEDYLGGHHPDITELELDTDEPIPSWQALAASFPNLARIKIREIGPVGGKLLIDSDFFAAFPALAELDADTRDSNALAADLSGLNPAHLAKLQRLKIESCRSGDISVLGDLPLLESLSIEVDAPAIRFHTGAASALKKLQLVFSESVRQLDLDLASAPVAKLDLGSGTYYRQLPGPVEIQRLRPPATLSGLKIGLRSETPFPADLQLPPTLTDVEINLQGKATLPPAMLGPQPRLHRLEMSLEGETAPLPAGFFAGLSALRYLKLNMERTPVEGPLLPAGLPLTELHYHNAPGLLGETDTLQLPKLEIVWLSGVGGDQLAWLAHSRKVRYLNIHVAENFHTLPELPALKDFALRDSRLASLPESLRRNTRLQGLTLLGCTLPELGDIRTMSGLKRIWIAPPRRDQRALPPLDDIAHLPGLEQLRLDIDLQHFDPAWMSLAPGAELGLDEHKLVEAYRILRASHLDTARVLEYLQILLDVRRPTELPPMPADFHLVLMAAKLNRFKAQHKTWLRGEAEKTSGRAHSAPAAYCSSAAAAVSGTRNSGPGRRKSVFRSAGSWTTASPMYCSAARPGPWTCWILSASP
ncbi:hypothetical protein [Microbulbifer taiwanensis]|uniref:hypothetical protein n=1 Tax=Microbulbifer taiwanensis TaxID=986746 RepID=UPI003613EEC0